MIPPDRLRDVWPLVKHGLEQMPADDWIPEDVYHAIRSGNAALHLFGESFLVLEATRTEYTRLPVLHVWLAYNAHGHDVIEAGLSLIHATAQRMDAHKITFGSPRKGWSKRYPLITATYEIA